MAVEVGEAAAGWHLMMMILTTLTSPPPSSVSQKVSRKIKVFLSSRCSPAGREPRSRFLWRKRKTKLKV